MCTRERVAALARIVGREHVLTDREVLVGYSRDMSEAQPSMPGAVVMPGSTAEVSQVVAFANEERLPVTPRGGGTGLAGGAVPFSGGMVLSLDRMTEVRSLDAEAGTIEVEVGATVDDVRVAARSAGLLYPPAPSSSATCHIGGAVAVDASGARSFKYGSTRQFVLDLEYVTADGVVHSLDSIGVPRPAKRPLTDILVGSEGTLAVITACLLRLVERPQASSWFLASFESIEAALAFAGSARQLPQQPVACELLDGGTLDALRHANSMALSVPEGEALVLLEFFGRDEQSIERQALEADVAATACSSLSSYLAQDARDRERCLQLRNSASTALRKQKVLFALDSCVPPSRLSDLLRVSRTLAERFGVARFAFGHVGDGHLHLLFVPGTEPGDMRRLREELFELVSSLGGSLTGEHGIGCERTRYLSAFLSLESLELMKRVKSAFDPRGVLNPGKVLQETSV